jgi:hypothetical protein
MAQQPRDTTQANVLLGIGAVLLLAGGLGARLGTTNLGLFVFYIIVFLAGIVAVGAGQRLRNRKYEE